MPVSDAPEPAKVVALIVPATFTVPLIFKAPLSVVVPMATPVDQVDDPPVTVPVKVGDAESTTLPVPVDAVVHEMAEPLVAVQKLLIVRVP